MRSIVSKDNITKRNRITINKIEQQKTQNKVIQTKQIRPKKVKHVAKPRTSDDPASKIMLGMSNTGSDYANILNTDYKDKSVLNQAIGHAFEGKWDKAGQVIQENPYRFAGNLAVEAGSALIPVGAVLKVVKAGKIVSKVANKTEGLIAKAVNKAIPVDNKYVKKFIDLEQPKKPTPEQWRSLDKSKQLGDDPISPMAFSGPGVSPYNTIKINIKAKITNFRNRNKVINFYNPLHINVKDPIPPEVQGFVSTKSREMIEINPLSFHGSDDNIIKQFVNLDTHEVLFHKAVPDAIAGKNIVTPKAATASTQGDNLAYRSPNFQSRAIDELNKGDPSDHVQPHIIQIINDFGLPGGSVKPWGPKGSVISTRQHNIKGIDTVSGFTKEAESTSTFKRGDFGHHDDVIRVRKAFKEAREAGEVRGFTDEKKTLNKLYKDRWKDDGGSSIYYPYMTASEKKKAKWFRNNLIPYQLKQIAKEEKKIKQLNYIRKTPNPVPFSAKLIEKNEEKNKQSFGGFGQFL